MLEMFTKFSIAMKMRRKDEEGASAVEYGLLVALIAAVVVAAVVILGDMVDQTFRDTCTEITNNDGAGATAECT